MRLRPHWASQGSRSEPSRAARERSGGSPLRRLDFCRDSVRVPLSTWCNSSQLLSPEPPAEVGDCLGESATIHITEQHVGLCSIEAEPRAAVTASRAVDLPSGAQSSASGSGSIFTVPHRIEDWRRVVTRAEMLIYCFSV